MSDTFIATCVYERLIQTQDAIISSQNEALEKCFSAANEYAKTNGNWEDFEVVL